ncbi:hypothetical protein [Nocardia stercoris]|uniref:Uncharacterized protein n=1 Tax=Nocardia stercoris TaxID=2483361 RepID=A0A3M2LFQ0_9NOCA|nr:hypothetical protein [Nocardia stercoris]RMI33548.1 hypothetical protein EBN03_10570 [Nocardia stercoris]
MLPVAVAALTAHAGAPVVAIAVPAAAAGGAVVLGGAQAAVLRTVLPVLRIRDWVPATMAGAVLASVALLVVVLHGRQIATWSSWAQTSVLVVCELTAVCSVGIAQAAVLRRACDRDILWVLATVIGTVAGVAAGGAALVPLRFGPHSAALTIPAVVFGIAAMTLAAATVTGRYLERIVTAPHALNLPA